MPRLVMPPFDFGKAQVQFRSTYKSNTHRSDEQSEGEQMEVDSVVTSESHLTKLEVASRSGIIFSVIDFLVEKKALYQFKPMPL